LDMVLVDKDAWGVSTGLDFPLLLAEGPMQRKRKQQQQQHLVRHPKMILIATHLSSSEMERARAAGYADTVIMKPLRASMMGACLEQILMTDNAGLDPGGPAKRAANLRQLLSGRLILIVDDNRINRLVAAGALKKYGAEVQCAESGRDAVAKLRPPHSFDACFMDIQMPEMDGSVQFGVSLK
jgi:histidine kinase 2/3/4 (cytokinin receptor)